MVAAGLWHKGTSGSAGSVSTYTITLDYNSYSLVQE